MTHYNDLPTHREFIAMNNYGGAIPLSAPIQELLCSKLFKYFQLLPLGGDTPNSPVHIELLDKNTNQSLLKVRFGNPDNPEPPLLGLGLYIEHVHSDVYEQEAQDALVAGLIGQLFAYYKDLMFVRLSPAINLSRYSSTLNSHEHRFFTRPNARTVHDYIPDDIRNLTRVNAQELLTAWGANDEQIRDITLNDDMEALSNIQAIQDMLDATFINPTNRNGFMSMTNRNPPFNGLTPIEYLTKNPARAIDIAEHIRSVGMPW
ncbi:hypothetical protein H4F18_15355 [Vibrio scophthalmi]|uniref:hypothetical protein n=1 Tax=Vibrio scophthalmi TaxID=45658 RepID=UPI002FF3E52A